MVRYFKRGKAMRTSWVWLAAAAICGFAQVAAADVIAFSGAITQSTSDGTGPAVNNPALNLIADGDPFTVTLNFAGSIGSPGTYPLTLTGAGMIFQDPTAPAIENLFVSASLTVSPDVNPLYDDISLLGCLSSGSGCAFGNQLDANFAIPATGLNSQNVAAIGLDQPHPLDLLEDDGATDIQGSITGYSYVPEPSLMALVGCALAALVAANRRLVGGDKSVQIKEEKSI
jgi:hypothetical protein